MARLIQWTKQQAARNRQPWIDWIAECVAVALATVGGAIILALILAGVIR